MFILLSQDGKRCHLYCKIKDRIELVAYDLHLSHLVQYGITVTDITRITQ